MPRLFGIPHPFLFHDRFTLMLAIFLDTETTGLDPFSHQLLEIAFKIIDLDSGKEKIAYESGIQQSLAVWEKRDLNSVEVNGFTWEKVQKGKKASIVREEIIQIFQDHQIRRGEAVFICQNPSFDRSFFAQLIDAYTQEYYQWPYHWLDFASMYWTLQVKAHQNQQQVLPSNLSLSKNAIAQHYQLLIEEMPHSALNGVNHLLLCYKKVIGFNTF